MTCKYLIKVGIYRKTFRMCLWSLLLKYDCRISYHLNKLFSFKAEGKEMASCIEWTSISTNKVVGKKKWFPKHQEIQGFKNI